MTKLLPFTVRFMPLLLVGTLIAPVSAQQAASPVRIEEVRQTVFTPTVDIVGTVHSRHNVQLTAGVDGRLDWVVEPGALLNKGDEVARVDQLPLQLQQAEQKAEIKRAQINQQFLKRELDRLAELRETNSASAFEYDQTRSQYELAGADLDIAKLRLHQIEDQLSRAVVRAPFDGVITERLREAGADVNRSEILVRMLDTENLEGRVFVPVKYLPFVRSARQIEVSSDNAAFTAEVKAIIPAADTRSQSFELRVTLPPQSNTLWAAGQLIRASLPVQAPQEMLTVHRDALILRREGTFVVVIDEDNKAHRRQVKVGEGQDDWVSVTADTLKAGDRVATRGAERLQDGQEVSVAEVGA